MSGLGDEVEGCVLCDAVAAGPEADQEKLVLYRGRLNYIIINKYSYTSGHLMVAPYDHITELGESSEDQLAEMMLLARDCEEVLAEHYHPHGFNIGMNIGRAAGAGIWDHQHLHVVPRWLGDASFMSATADTRVIPETPDATFTRLRPVFDARFSPGATERD